MKGVIWIIFAAISIGTIQAQSLDSLAVWLKQGDALLLKGEYEEIMPLAIKVIVSKDSDRKAVSHASHTLAMSYWKQGFYDLSYRKAKDAYLFAENSTRQVEALDLLLKTSLKKELYDTAIYWYDQYIPLVASNPTAHHQALMGLLIAQLHTKKFNEAIISAQKRLEILESSNDASSQEISNTLNALGTAYKENSMLDKALSQYQKALTHQSDNIITLQNLGAIYTLLGNKDASKQALEKALSILEKKEPSNGLIDTYNLLASLEYHFSDFPQALLYSKNAIAVSEKVNNPTKHSEAYAIQAEVYAQMSEFKKSQEALKSRLNYSNIANTQLTQQRLFGQQAQAQAERKENQYINSLAEKEQQNLAIKQLELTNKQRQQEVELLKQEQDLQKAVLANQMLEKQQAEQALQTARNRLLTEQQKREIEDLAREKQLQTLTLKQQQLEKEEHEKELALLTSQNDLLEKEKALNKAEQEQQAFRAYIITVTLILAFILLSIAVWALVKFRKQNRELSKQKNVIQEKNNMLLTSEEELRQNIEELTSIQEVLEAQKQELERSFITTKKQQKKIEESNRKIAKQMEELQVAQKQMVQSEKMASIGQLTAGVAHEINNPVNFIAGGSQTLKVIVQDITELLDLYAGLVAAKELQEQKEIEASIHKLEVEIGSKEELKEDAFALLSDIEKGTDRVTEIVRGLRNFSRADSEQRITDNLHDNINNTLLILHSKYADKITVVKNFDPNISTIECYPGQLGQVFMNIINNAIDALQNQGIITIATMIVGDKIQITIHDDGPGIPQEVQSNIFDPFFTTKDVGKGTGLGLSIVHGIMKKHYGKIEVFSNPTDGTKFILELPR